MKEIIFTAETVIRNARTFDRKEFNHQKTSGTLFHFIPQIYWVEKGKKWGISIISDDFPYNIYWETEEVLNFIAAWKAIILLKLSLASLDENVIRGAYYISLDDLVVTKENDPYLGAILRLQGLTAYYSSRARKVPREIKELHDSIKAKYYG